MPKAANFLGMPPTNLIVNFHHDPGHGWGEVSLTVLKELEIDDKITEYSFQKGESVFLEEDLDFPLFAKTVEEKWGAIVKTMGVYHEDAPMRTYDSYKKG